jgi:predicted amino acid-binding ACT domain protein
VTLRRVPDRPGIAASVFDALAGANVNVDMIVQNVGADGSTDMTFTVGKADLARAEDVLGRVRDELGYEALLADPEVAKISVVGIGMRSHTGVANTMFRALAEKGINIQVISTSEIKVSVLVGADYTELAVRALHTGLRPRRAGGMMAMDMPLLDTASPAAATLDRLMARGAAFLGSRVAVMGGAMSWVSERNLVAALSNAGASA